MISRVSILFAGMAVLSLLAGRVLGQETQRPAGAAKRVVLMIGEDEYKTWETLPAFAEKELTPRGTPCASSTRTRPINITSRA